MALQMRSNGLSNEAIYRENWAAYVDSAIFRHESSGAQGVGDPIDLRDVMRLEELLSKIEHAAAACEGGGRALGSGASTHLLLEQQETENKAPARTRDSHRDGARPRGKERKPLKIIPDPPPLCQSPSTRTIDSAPSRSPCPASGQDGQDGAPLDVPRLGSNDEREQQEHTACSSGRSSERVTAVATKEETGKAETAAAKQNRRDAGISTPSLVAGKVAAVVCLFEGLTANIGGRRDEKNEGLSHDKLQASGNRDGRTTVSEKSRCPASPVVPELEGCVDEECSPRLVPLDSGLDAPVPHDSSSPYLQTVGDAKGPQTDRSLNDDDCCTARMARCEGHAETPIEQGGNREQCPSAGEALGAESVLAADVLSPSALLDVTCIEAEEGASPEEQLPSALSQDCSGLLEGTVLGVRQGSSRGDLSGVGMTAADMGAAGIEAAAMEAADGEGTLLSDVGQDLSPLEPSDDDYNGAAGEVAPFDLTNDQQSWEGE
ncbi:unnamed protein product, partial [Laminaria digitata]